jgi:hypothetical protein
MLWVPMNMIIRTDFWTGSDKTSSDYCKENMYKLPNDTTNAFIEVSVRSCMWASTSITESRKKKVRVRNSKQVLPPIGSLLIIPNRLATSLNIVVLGTKTLWNTTFGSRHRKSWFWKKGVFIRVRKEQCYSTLLTFLGGIKTLNKSGPLVFNFFCIN